jgi:hypothetical protein
VLVFRCVVDIPQVFSRMYEDLLQVIDTHLMIV